jgi:hypothetical protein
VKLVPNISVTASAVELGVRGHDSNVRPVGTCLEIDRQGHVLLSQSPSRPLQQIDPRGWLNENYPLHSAHPRERFVPSMMQSRHEKCADRFLRRPRGTKRRQPCRQISPAAWRAIWLAESFENWHTGVRCYSRCPLVPAVIRERSDRQTASSARSPKAVATESVAAETALEATK